MVPLIAAIILTSMGQDRLDARRIVGLVIGFAGVACLVGLDIQFDDLVAVGAVMLTAIGYAIGPIIINRKLADLPSLGVVTASLIVATVLYAPFSVWLWPDRITAPAAWSIVGLAVVCTAIAFLVFFALIAEAGPARATVITYINPAVAITLGVLLLDEPFTMGMAIGFPLVILGSILATSRSADGDSRTPAVPSGIASSGTSPARRASAPAGRRGHPAGRSTERAPCRVGEHHGRTSQTDSDFPAEPSCWAASTIRSAMAISPSLL